jgi:hypothetical protein
VRVGRLSRDAKTTPAEHAIVVRNALEFDLGPKAGSTHRFAHQRCVFRMEIKQRGDEHVARDSADWIQM